MKFIDYKLNNKILKALDIIGYEKPTEVQKKVLSELQSNEDLIVKAQTGSGKTASFGIPICEYVDWEENKPQALVITPTRELALQVKEEIFNIGRFKRLKVAAVFGKSPFYAQQRELKQKTHVVVGTPGRLLDHMEKGTLDISMIKYLVIDEADEMLNMGFIDQLDAILSKLPENRRSMLFSATMPDDITDLCDKYLKEPKQIEIDEENTATERIEQKRYDVLKDDKISLLKAITIMENPDTCIIFCNTQQQVDDVAEALARADYLCDKIHGGMYQRERLRAMEKFKRGYYRYLIATDVAARGIDVDNISLVINYDLPFEPDSYVHRIGRTGRKGQEGKAISFVEPRDKRLLRDIETYIDREIEVFDIPEDDEVEANEKAFYEKMDTRLKRKQAKGEELNTDIMKLHINAGKKTKMRAVDIVGTLCSIEGMTADDIGIIDIQDISTFVEILHGKGEMVYKVLQNKNIKGRPRKVSKANKVRIR